jgi:hypothetical protein
MIDSAGDVLSARVIGAYRTASRGSSARCTATIRHPDGELVATRTREDGVLGADPAAPDGGQVHQDVVALGARSCR